jgi:hypothetical protein
VIVDSARAANVADRMHEHNLRRVWPPPDQKRERPAPHHEHRPDLEFQSSSTAEDSDRRGRAQLIGSDLFRLQRGAEHVHRLGARPLAELLAQIGTEQDCIADILALLDQWRERLAPETVRLVGGDRFPRRVPLAVP